MNALPSKEELLAYQARWIRRAGTAALLGAFLVTGAIVLQRAGLNLPDSSSDADQLSFAHAHSGRLILSSVIQGIGFTLFLFPLLFLFRSAAGRSERVRRAFAGLVVVGPLAFGVGLAISSVGTSQAADKFVDQAPAAEQNARSQAEAAATAASQGKQPAKPAKGASKNATTAPSSTATATTPTTTTTTTTANGTTTTAAAAKPKTPDQAASGARESLADHLNRHTTLLVVGGLISTFGVLALVFAMIYTSLWSMRVGLLTRFWGSLGIAFGLFLVIPLFPPIPGLVLWFAATGLMFLGVWPRPLPPAWDAGEAIPWSRPGDMGAPPDLPAPDGTVEGSGREVSERPLPEATDGTAEPVGPPEPPQPPYGESQGQRRKKRKRRD